MKESTIKTRLEKMAKELRDNGHFYTNDGTQNNEIAYSQEWITTNTPPMFKGKKWESDNIPNVITEDMIISAACWLEMD